MTQKKMVTMLDYFGWTFSTVKIRIKLPLGKILSKCLEIRLSITFLVSQSHVGHQLLFSTQSVPY